VKRPPSTAIVWFAVLGGGAAWATQFVANLFISFAKCNGMQGQRAVPLRTLSVVLSVAAIAVALAAEGAALRLFVRTSALDHVAQDEFEGRGSTPPVGRINFLATVGLLVNFLALAIVVMTAIGTPLLNGCQQS
jgi:hypothetical protein